MKSKWPLFVGILLLITGIIMKKVTDLTALSIILILSGVLFKAYYIISKIKNNEYKPGYEVGLLIIGLILFLSGLYFKKYESAFNYLFLIVPGLTFKVGFIVFFIRRIRLKQIPRDLSRNA